MTIPEGWTAHNGSDACPVAFNALVHVLYRDGVQYDFGMAGDWAWYHDGAGDDIIAYQEVKQ